TPQLYTLSLHDALPIYPSKEELPRVHAAVARAYAAPGEWLPLAEQYVLPGGVAICMLGPSDEAPERVGELQLQRELAYVLPYSRSEEHTSELQSQSNLV